MNLGNVIVAVGMLLSEIIDEDDDQSQQSVPIGYSLTGQRKSVSLGLVFGFWDVPDQN